MAEDAVLGWLRSCKCQKYGCMHKQAADEIERLRAAGDALVEALHANRGTGPAAAFMSHRASTAWQEARRG